MDGDIGYQDDNALNG